MVNFHDNGAQFHCNFFFVNTSTNIFLSLISPWSLEKNKKCCFASSSLATTLFMPQTKLFPEPWLNNELTLLLIDKRSLRDMRESIRQGRESYQNKSLTQNNFPFALAKIFYDPPWLLQYPVDPHDPTKFLPRITLLRISGPPSLA